MNPMLTHTNDNDYDNSLAPVLAISADSGVSDRQLVAIAIAAGPNKQHEENPWREKQGFCSQEKKLVILQTGNKIADDH